MADIEIPCHQCGTVNTVSEFVDKGSIVCRSCKEQLSKPTAAGKPKHKPTVKHPAVDILPASPPNGTLTNSQTQPDSRSKLKMAPEQLTQTYKPEHTAHVEQTVRTTTKAKSEPTRFQVSEHMLAWLLFLILGAGSGIIRYGHTMTPNALCIIDEWSPYVFLTIHVALCMAICKESVYHGILGLLMPPYMVYYLFAVSDKFYIRGIVGGLAVGMGQATFIYWKNSLVVLFSFFDSWIHNPF